MLNLAVIGLGWWGRIIVDLARGSEKLRVVRVADVSPQAQAFAAERGLPFSSTLEEVLSDASVQAVVLCTPHTLHTDQIVAAARAGKHVFCEKPLSMTRRDVLRALAAVEEAGVTLALELLNSRVNHPDYQCDRTIWGRAVCDLVASPRVKLLYDIYHMQIMEGDLAPTIEKHLAMIPHMQLADTLAGIGTSLLATRMRQLVSIDFRSCAARPRTRTTTESSG